MVALLSIIYSHWEISWHNLFPSQYISVGLLGEYKASNVTYLANFWIGKVDNGQHYWICLHQANLCILCHRDPENCDWIKLADRILDGLVFALLFVKILKYLSVETGMAVGSIFAVGSTGTLIISLGSQEIAKGVVSGVEMTASDRFYEGDNVHFGDGTQGYIQKMGKLSLCLL